MSVTTNTSVIVRNWERVKSLESFGMQQDSQGKSLALISFISGQISLWDHETNEICQAIQASEKPTRTLSWIDRMSWVITGSDDCYLRIFSFSSAQCPLIKFQEWKAHDDYIRCVQAHPSLPFILSASDDRTIKSWNWENEFQLEKIFEGHSHYVMVIKINPNDHNSFASASLDGTIKIWDVSTGESVVTLVGHEKGINCIDYHPGPKQQIISGADDFTIKLWDIQTGVCLYTFLGHEGNLTSVLWHPMKEDLLFSTSEDTTVRMWQLGYSESEQLSNPQLGRAWAMAVSTFCSNSELLSIGYDFGMMTTRLRNHFGPNRDEDVLGNIGEHPFKGSKPFEHV